MKLKAFCTVLFYALGLLLLTAPTVFIAFGGWARNSLTFTDGGSNHP
jgi:hypothetical protein